MKYRLKTFGSICSGIEAASFVLEPLGYKPLWFSEIADFPKRFLKVLHPCVNNLGDMNDIPELLGRNQIDCPDILCGGTPCQAFSLAGWKNGLNDDRGQLTLKYCDILDAIDRIRISRGLPRCIFFWENVEGVLKDRTNVFGRFLAGILRMEKPLEITVWPNAGYICGKERNIGWRILDAKYFGIPQQRKRLYVVGGGKDFDPLNVLFDKSEPFIDPYDTAKAARRVTTLFENIDESQRRILVTSLSKTEPDGTTFEVFRHYSDCVYAAYGTKWNGNAASFNGSLFVAQNGRVRRLTPKECERLMGFPDDYTYMPKCRPTNRYQAIGNSWAIPVVRWIFKRLPLGFGNTISLPEVCPIHLDSRTLLYNMNGFVPSNGSFYNATTAASDYVLSNMLDIVENVTDEKFYLSAAGCAGILRRKAERNARINPRLEILLNESIRHYS